MLSLRLWKFNLVDEPFHFHCLREFLCSFHIVSLFSSFIIKCARSATYLTIILIKGLEVCFVIMITICVHFIYGHIHRDQKMRLTYTRISNTYRKCKVLSLFILNSIAKKKFVSFSYKIFSQNIRRFCEL